MKLKLLTMILQPLDDRDGLLEVRKERLMAMHEQNERDHEETMMRYLGKRYHYEFCMGDYSGKR